ncbi:hypothetical protein EVAR_57530_1 [Eumeta japonica]|uniref:Uncharacterized protein n=1 Tax=Eumeta variegata TaxID=151549 RepID=A0A4C1Y071_EUMVA|nr:hypothetical protein EVAR_57530_1 [Eumeta japonica]
MEKVEEEEECLRATGPRSWLVVDGHRWVGDFDARFAEGAYAPPSTIGQLPRLTSAMCVRPQQSTHGRSYMRTTTLQAATTHVQTTEMSTAQQANAAPYILEGRRAALEAAVLELRMLILSLLRFTSATLLQNGDSINSSLSPHRPVRTVISREKMPGYEVQVLSSRSCAHK